MSRTVAVIQARMGSTRLPGKVMLDLAGETMLARVVTRVRMVRNIDEIVVATTQDPSDDRVVDLCSSRGWNVYRGSMDDVLDRYYQTAVQFSADFIVRITSDCPLIDPPVVSRIISEFREQSPEIDYCSNVFPTRTYPRGLDTEVMRFDTLKYVWEKDTNPAFREHVTLFIQKNPALFRIRNVTNDRDYSYHRWTVDTWEDYELIRSIYGHFGNRQFGWMDVIRWLDSHPELIEMNKHIKQKVV